MKRRPILLAGISSVLSACTTTAPRVSATPAQLRKRDWTSFDGKTMPFTTWSTPRGKKPRGIILAVHGLSGAASDFWPLGESLRQRGITTYALELRGQGNDPQQAERGDIRDEKLWQRDLKTFHALLRQRHPRTPIFWYGESLGSLVVMHTLAQISLADQPQGILLASPVAGLRMEVSAAQRWMLETGAAVTPRTRLSLGTLAGVDESSIQVTSTTTHGSQMAKTPHHISAFSLRLIVAIGRMIDALPAAAAGLRQPLLVLASPHDVISSPEQIQAFFDQIGSREKKLLWFTRSRHLILHDVQRVEALQDIIHWLEGQI
ncbi:MAG: alpha/beta fold hydrolase [Verrucomicrobiaceae bacterium]|nr:alpha/beta fold hydrolase [Verrucomicrobiaceae bacterium]